MHVEFLLHEVLLLCLRVSFPVLVRHVATVKHGGVGDSVAALEALELLVTLVLLLVLAQSCETNLLLLLRVVIPNFVLVALFADGRVDTVTHDGLCNSTLDIVVSHVGLRLQLEQSRGLVDAVVCT